MSDRHEVAATAPFPHDAIARMRQLQQLGSRHDRPEQNVQNRAVSDAPQHAAPATR